MVKIYLAVKEGMDKLEGIETSLLDSQLILSDILGVERTYLLLNREKEITNEEYKVFIEKINLRKNGMPLQYITGKQEFMGIMFKVCKGVLIPRNDTEILVEEVINIAKNIQNPIIIDVGCGSGAISISLAKFIEDSNIYALDIMDTPLKITKENSILNGVEERVNIIKSNMLSNIKDTNEKVDFIISNPPYIKTSVIPTLMKEVKEHEPINALDGGEDGLYFYRNITHDAKKLLKENGYLVYEIGHDQKEDVKNIMINEGFKNIKVIKDLSGLDRVVIGNK